MTEGQERKTNETLWALVVAGVLATVGILVGTGIGYWSYAMRVPPPPPAPPPTRGPNGYADALQLVASLHRTNPRFWCWAILATSLEVPLPLPALERRLRSLHPLLDHVRATLRKEWKPVRPANPMLTPMSPAGMALDSCALAFAGECRVRRAHGDPAGAMQYALDTLELGQKLASCGGIEFRIHGAVVHVIGLRQAEQTAWRLPRAAAVHALAQTRRLRREWPPLSATMAIERQEAAMELNRMFAELNQVPLTQKSGWLDDRLDLDEEDASWTERLELLAYPRRRMLADADHYFQAQIAELRKPLPQRAPVARPNGPWSSRLLAQASWVSTESWRWERMDTDLALLGVALAVRIQFLEQGHFPKSLGEVAPQWLPKVPLDLWQQPLVYRLKNGKPLLYSLGPNGIDDGGQPVDRRVLNLTASTPGDLVFGQLAPAVKSKVPSTALPGGPL